MANGESPITFIYVTTLKTAALPRDGGAGARNHSSQQFILKHHRLPRQYKFIIIIPGQLEFE